MYVYYKEIYMSEWKLPGVVYRTQHRFSDYATENMKCGDLTERQIRKDYGLDDVSDVVNPWTGEEISMFSVFSKPRIRNKREVAQLLFNEFLQLSLPVYYFGKRQLCIDLVKHFYNGRGNCFSSPFLDSAYKERILSDISEKDSSLMAIKKTINDGINFNYRTFSQSPDNNFTQNIHRTLLPKFGRYKDYFNDLGMSVHDVYATNIELIRLEISSDKFMATVKCTGQDHFGLDRNDIMNKKFHYIRAFRIWFILQHWQNFGFKPCFTNMSATISFEGERKR